MTDRHVRKVYSASAEALGDKRQVRVVCSTDEVDRAGDIVVQDGIDFSAYMASGAGPVLWNHDPDVVIGKCIEIGVRDGKLQALVQFPPEGEDPEADLYYGKIKFGSVSGVSIGFNPLDADPLDKGNPKRGPQRYLKSEMLEFSFTPVQANRGAIVVERSRKTFDPSQPRAEAGSANGGQWVKQGGGPSMMAAQEMEDLLAAMDPDAFRKEMSELDSLMDEAAAYVDELNAADKAILAADADDDDDAFDLANDARAQTQTEAAAHAGAMRDKLAAMIEKANARLAKMDSVLSTAKQAEMAESGHKAALAQVRRTGARAVVHRQWKVGVSRYLACARGAWNAPAAAESIFAHAGFDGSKPDTAFARKGFLVYDAARPEDKSAYRLPFAEVKDGRLVVMSAGLRDAAKDLDGSGLPADVVEKARAVLEHYEAKMAEQTAAAPRKIKGLWEVARLATVLDELGCLEECVEWEAAMEGDGSSVPVMLGEALQQLGAALIAMTAEEVAELLNEEAEEGAPAAIIGVVEASASPLKKAFAAARYKAGRRISADTNSVLDKACKSILEGHDTIRALMTPQDEDGSESEATEKDFAPDRGAAPKLTKRQRLVEVMRRQAV